MPKKLTPEMEAVVKALYDRTRPYQERLNAVRKEITRSDVLSNQRLVDAYTYELAVLQTYLSEEARIAGDSLEECGYSLGALECLDTLH